MTVGDYMTAVGDFHSHQDRNNTCTRYGKCFEIRLLECVYDCMFVCVCLCRRVCKNGYKIGKVQSINMESDLQSEFEFKMRL